MTAMSADGNEIHEEDTVYVSRYNYRAYKVKTIKEHNGVATLQLYDGTPYARTSHWVTSDFVVTTHPASK